MYHFANQKRCYFYKTLESSPPLLESLKITALTIAISDQLHDKRFSVPKKAKRSRTLTRTEVRMDVKMTLAVKVRKGPHARECKRLLQANNSKKPVDRHLDCHQ